MMAGVVMPVVMRLSTAGVAARLGLRIGRRGMLARWLWCAFWCIVVVAGV